MKFISDDYYIILLDGITHVSFTVDCHRFRRSSWDIDILYEDGKRFCAYYNFRDGEEQANKMMGKLRGGLDPEIAVEVKS